VAVTPLEPLAPDQRAVVSLVLQQGRSYEEIAALLGIPVDAVRARAHAGLAALARDNGLPGEITAPLADYLLGQQQAPDAEATRGLLSESAPASAWASDVAAQLRELAPRGLPRIPAAPRADESEATSPGAAADARQRPASTAAGTGAAGPPPPRPRPAREAAAAAAREPAAAPGGAAPPPASRLGGALLIAAVLAAVALVLFLVLREGDGSGDERVASSDTPAATATPTPTPSPAAAQVADTIRLRPAAGGDAGGKMTVYLQGDRLLFELVAQNVPPSAGDSAYAIWFTGPGDRARRLGFTNPVGADGKLGIQGPSESELAGFPKLYATYANVVVSRESTEDATRPSRVILTGRLPKGR
jgi:Sigma-70, region 4